MLSLVSTEDPPNCRTARQRDPGFTQEAGIYSELAMGDTTLYTFLGERGLPIGYLMVPNSITHGVVTPEIRALYNHFAAASASSIRTG